jgi:hypothetical protein
MLYPYPAGRELSVLDFLFSRQLASTRLPVWSSHRHPNQCESKKPSILKQHASRKQRVWGSIGNLLVMDRSRNG